MKRMCFLSLINVQSLETGIERKVINQYSELRKYFDDSFFFGFLGNNKFGLLNRNIAIDVKFKKYPHIEIFTFLSKFIVDNNVDFLYIRYNHFSSPFFISFLKKIKNINNDVIIYIEIPTYPYDEEYRHVSYLAKCVHYMDVFYRKKLKYYINRIVTYSTDKEIWGIKCLNISNAVDFNSIELSHVVRQNNLIRLTMVSSMEFWHGIDRLILSLKNYLIDRFDVNVILNIVGDINIPYAKKMISLVENDSLLCKHVIFHGFKSGRELNDIYDKTDIAIGSIGVHRKGIIQMQSLKNREYAAKGLPFVISHKDKDFMGKPYVFYIKPDESFIDFYKMIEWYNNLAISPNEIREDVKELSWEMQMKFVFEDYMMHH